MKHIKPYKIFESLDNHKSLISDLEYMCLEIKDVGVTINISSEKVTPDISSIKPSATTKSYIDAIKINISRYDKSKGIYGLISYDEANDIKYFIERSIGYMKGWEFTLIGNKSSEFKDIDLNNLDKYEYNEIRIYFYKPNDTYHVISYTDSHWNLKKCDFNTLHGALEYIESSISRMVLGTNKVKYKVITDKEYWEAIGNRKYFK